LYISPNVGWGDDCKCPLRSPLSVISPAVSALISYVSEGGKGQWLAIDELRVEIAKGWEGEASDRSVEDIVKAELAAKAK